MSRGFLSEKRNPGYFENMTSSVRKTTCDWRGSLRRSMKGLMCQAEELRQSESVKILSRGVPLTEKNLSKHGRRPWYGTRRAASFVGEDSGV